MPKKIEVPVEFSTRLINHGPMVLVTTAYNGKRNVMPLAWVMPVSHTPRMVAIAMSASRYTYELLKGSGEFVLNIPCVEQKELVQKCGKTSGRAGDKFTQLQIITLPAKKVKAPLIEACVAHIECKFSSEMTVGDHQVVIGEIVAASANEGVLNAKGIVDLKKAHMLHHLGGTSFSVSEKEV